MVNIDQLTYESSPDTVAVALLGELKSRGHGRDTSIAVVSTGFQESGLRMVKHPTADWWGYFQQDASYPNRRSPAGNIRGFLDRLEKQLAKPGASPDIWKNIFWLQQGPNHPSADHAYNVGRKAYLTEIQKHVDRATNLYNRFSGVPTMGWTGDPVWLEEVLRPALGNRLRTLNGWQQRGHGDFKDIRGIMMHHTGNGRASAESIRDGRPDLAGPLSQLHVAQDGTVTIVCVGVAWHAGTGGGVSWLNGTSAGANFHSIGIECAWPMDTSITAATQGRERWPDKQIISMRDTVAAILKKLGYGPDRVTTHALWAGAAQGKWDPGNFDINWFRKEVQKDLDGFVFPGEGPVAPPPPPPVVQPPPQLGIGPIPGFSDRELDEEILRQLRGPYLKGWPQLENLSLVDYLAEFGRRQKSIEAMLIELLDKKKTEQP